jgi:hypothetical protein
MRKFATFSIAVLVLCVWGLGCTTVVVKEDRGPELLLPGELIETVDANTILVKCTGIGPDQRIAIDQARKGCLEWVITNQMAQTPGEKQAYMAQQQSIFQKMDRYVNIPPPGARSGKGKGVKSQVRISDEEIKVIIITDVHKKALQDDLVAMGVIGSKDDMLEAVGMPTLMVHPSKANKGKKNRKIMEDLVNSYLTKSKWEVLDAKGVADLNKLVDAIGEVAEAEEDEAAKLALAVGADVYIIFEANKKKEGSSVAYEVGISAYETTTGRKLASETALSSPRSTWTAGEESAAMMEGLNDAMGKVVPQITDYWKEDAPKGNRFTVVLKNAPKNTDMKLAPVMKRMCRFVKTKSFPGQVNFYAQCKGDNLELAGGLAEGIDAKLSGHEYEFVAKNANNLLIVFK